jgi:hypothetical protein
MAIHPVVQAVVAVAIVLIVWFVLIPYCFNKGLTIAGPGVKMSVPIIVGTIMMNKGDVVIDTADSTQLEYVALPPSNNLKGGIQYSYSMWMNKSNLTSAVANRVLLLRGLPKMAQVVTLNKDAGTAGATWTDGSDKKYTATTVTQPLVQQPLVMFGADENTLKVRFNTIKQPNNEVTLTGDMLNILNTNAWYLLTFTFQDGYSIDGFEDGVMFQFFINDKQMTSVTFPNDALVTNQDPVNILPDLGQSLVGKSGSTSVNSNYSQLAGQMADVTYHNYALKANDILPIVMKGFNNAPYTTPGSRKANANAQQYYSMSLNNSLDNL